VADAADAERAAANALKLLNVNASVNQESAPRLANAADADAKQK